MDKVEEHFEGSRPPNRMRRALFGVGFLVFLAFMALFVKLSLPTQRMELVGKWKGTSKAGLSFDFRGDGTFSGVISPPYWVGSGATEKISCSGQWKANHNALYLTFNRYELLAKPKVRYRFDEAQKEALTRPFKEEISWVSEDKWTLAGMVTETYVRDGGAPKTAPPSP